jgi:tetratricopeptide (TPR) repeat protein
MIQILGALSFLVFAAHSARGQQIGKFVPIAAGSEADHAITQINATSDPAQKLALIDKFASDLAKGDLAIVADELYVNYYISQKNYNKAIEYGEKLFALDPDNFTNAVNMVRATSEKGDVDKLMAYGEKAQAILQRYKASPAPAGMAEGVWADEKARTLESNKDSIAYVPQAVYIGIYQTANPANRAALLVHFAQIFADSPYAAQALALAATSYQQAQNIPKMLETANGLLAKDPDNLGMLLLLSDYYGENSQQLDKAEAYAKRAISLLANAKKPEGLTDEQWQQQSSLEKGLALSALGQVNIEKKNNAEAVDNFKSAAPLLKSDEGSYGRNQYRLGFALLNLKRNAEAKEAFTEAASVNSPYKSRAQQKLKEMTAAASRKKGS